jgi:hypothetical protein
MDQALARAGRRDADRVPRIALIEVIVDRGNGVFLVLAEGNGHGRLPFVLMRGGGRGGRRWMTNIKKIAPLADVITWVVADP